VKSFEQIEENEMGKPCVIRDKREMHRFLVWKPQGTRPLGWTRLRWDDNIKMIFTEVGQ